jgi:hypothetical protein
MMKLVVCLALTKASVSGIEGFNVGVRVII